MATQDNSAAIYSTLTSSEIQILDAEKEYMDELYSVLNSKGFTDELKRLFIELNRNKKRIIDDYNGISIINTPAERLVTHCIYEDFLGKKTSGDSRYKTVRFYPLPECGDIGIELENVVLSVEVKTICITTNNSDLGYLPFRRNQTSFVNICEYSKCDGTSTYHPKFCIAGNIDKFVGNKPMLTYVVELVYSFDRNNHQTNNCELYDGIRSDGISTVNLFCIPNGYLGRFFDNNIFQNVKAYDYYSPDSDSGYSEPLKLDIVQYPNKRDCYTNAMALANAYAYIRKTFPKVTNAWKEINTTDYIAFIDTANTGKELHEKDGMLWILTEKNDSNKIKRPIISHVKSPNGCRIDWRTNLKARYDSKNNYWEGVRHITVR